MVQIYSGFEPTMRLYSPINKLDGEIYTYMEIRKKLKIGSIRIEEHIKDGLIELVQVPQYPECTFNKTGVCFSYKIEFEKYLNEYIQKTNP